MSPLIDHIVVDVRDRIAEGAARYRALGFALLPMGRHSLGSANHLAVFGPDYLELLGTDVPGGALRPDLDPFPVGLNGLVFRGEASEALSARQQAAGVPAQPALAFHRPVDLPDGSRADARFKVVRLDRASAFDGRVYWCEHLTPELVWRPEWQDHPNGALAVSRILISARDPDRQAALFARMFGPEAVTRGPGGSSSGRCRLAAGGAVVEVAPHAEVAAELGSAAPDPAGRGDHMAVLGLRVRDPRAVAGLLRANGIEGVAPIPGGLRIPAAAAMNATIEFTA